MSSPSTARMSDVLRAALLARPAGLREPLLVALALCDERPHVPLASQVAGARPDGVAVEKVRVTLRRMGAVPGDDLRWTLPRPRSRAMSAEQWTLDGAVMAMRAHHAVHGDWPTTREWRQAGPEHPHYQCRAIKAAGGFLAVLAIAQETESVAA